MKKRIIVICGPTGVGKTAVALQLAQQLNTSILSFDSRQCYKELNIGVAKPTIEELNLIPHYFMDSHSIYENVNAVVFEKYALEVLQKLFKTNETIIAVGGTGLYLDVLCNGIDAIPEIPKLLRFNLQKEFEQNGLVWLQNEIKKYDENFTDANDLNNIQRMLRALEVVIHTGNSIKYYQRKEKVQRDFEIYKYGLEMERDVLYDRVNKRVEIMMEHGLLEEVINLQAVQHLNALQTVGYKELFSFLKNEISLNKAVELVQQHSRNYAKRQMTWFKKDKDIIWGNANEIVRIAK